jgi:hypothetical protein
MIEEEGGIMMTTSEGSEKTSKREGEMMTTELKGKETIEIDSDIAIMKIIKAGETCKRKIFKVETTMLVEELFLHREIQMTGLLISELT